MGANLVGRAIAFAADVPLQPNEYRLLIGMCLTAMDDGTPPKYFDSREAMALALGRRVPDATPGESNPEREAAFKAVKVAAKGLVDLRAISRTKVGGNGRRAEYAMNLDLTTTRSTDEFKRRARRSPMTSQEARRRRTSGTAAVPVGGLPQYQLEDCCSAVEGLPQSPSGTRGEQEQLQEEQVTNASTSPESVDNKVQASDPHDLDGVAA